MRWERVQAQETEQGREEKGGSRKRWGHTCNAVKGGMFLYVFGGFGKDMCQTNQVDVFDTVEQTWSQPTIKGTPPAPRDGHSCTNAGDNLFVFGGTDGMNPLGDLHILDTSSHTCISPITRGEELEARQGHSAALVGKRLFIFGGYGKSPDEDDEVYYNDLFILNTDSSQMGPILLVQGLSSTRCTSEASDQLEDVQAQVTLSSTGESSGLQLDADSDDLLDEEPATVNPPNTRSRTLASVMEGSSKLSPGTEPMLDLDLSSSKKAKRAKKRKARRSQR